MSLNDDLTVIQRCVEDLARAVDRLPPRSCSAPDLRRVRADTEHLRESVALLRAAAAQSPAAPAPARQNVVPVPDTPYDRSLWTDSDDEGLGARDRHAP
ncbi:hypothetical protein GTW43_29960 [Streptomyces sp. SID5785]|uniref:hypothetical protein n=1 Tax=Streptomyces sp. SID5785 TaxID=2690309 RepID=UPI0013610AB4|nr:hypothetical protein [Streptomyces sp. SID5785]MZD09274.1 hypothetical protein [Streptomyces sp. SID5785]